MARFIMSAACSGAFFLPALDAITSYGCAAVAAKERPPGGQTKSPPTNPPFFPYQHNDPLRGQPANFGVPWWSGERACTISFGNCQFPSGDFSRGAISERVRCFWATQRRSTLFDACASPAKKVKRHSRPAKRGSWKAIMASGCAALSLA